MRRLGRTACWRRPAANSAHISSPPGRQRTSGVDRRSLGSGLRRPEPKLRIIFVILRARFTSSESAACASPPYLLQHFSGTASSAVFPRGCGLPGVLVGIGQRAENHFGQRIHISEQSLLPVLTRRTCFEYFSRDALMRFSDSSIVASARAVPFRQRPHERARARVVATFAAAQRLCSGFAERIP